MAVIRSVIRGVGAYLPKRIMTNDDLAKIVDTTDEWIVERTGISAAPHRRRRRADVRPRHRRGAAGAGARRHRSRRHRSRHLRDRDARPHLPGDRREDPGRARHHQGRRVRRPGGLLGLRLRADDRRQLPQDRPVQARARHRRGDVLAHSRLDRSLAPACCSATAPARSCSRRSRSTARARIAASSRRASAPTAATRICSTSTAGRARPRRSAICA